MVIAGIALIAGGVVIVASGAMARAGRLPLQWAVGIRTKTTMASEEAWHAAHLAGGLWIMIGGFVMAAGGVLAILAEDETTAAWFALGSALGALIPIVIGGVQGQRAARNVAV